MHMASRGIGSQRPRLTADLLVAVLLKADLWRGAFYLLPPFEGMSDPVARLMFALNCSCVAVLLAFLPGIEAVSHERLHSPAIDPLSGHESHRMKINLRYLQHTLEQLLLFVPGLLALAHYCPDGHAMCAVAATTVVWIASRAAFWIAYHLDPLYRVVGLTGMLQSMLVLLYVSARFGFDIGGLIGAAVPLALFAGIEGYLTYATRPRPA